MLGPVGHFTTMEGSILGLQTQAFVFISMWRTDPALQGGATYFMLPEAHMWTQPCVFVTLGAEFSRGAYTWTVWQGHHAPQATPKGAENIRLTGGNLSDASQPGAVKHQP